MEANIPSFSQSRKWAHAIFQRERDNKSILFRRLLSDFLNKHRQHCKRISNLSVPQCLNDATLV